MASDQLFCFSGKQILIVGTGPSEQQLKTMDVSNFDYAILLNHAIRNEDYLEGFGIQCFGASCDWVRQLEILRSFKRSQAPSLLSISRLYAWPVVLYLKLKNGGKIFWPRTTIRSTSKASRFKWLMPQTPTIDKPSLARINDSRSIAIMQHSVLFFVLQVTLSYNARQIVLVGCDLDQTSRPVGLEFDEKDCGRQFEILAKEFGLGRIKTVTSQHSIYGLDKYQCH